MTEFVEGMAIFVLTGKRKGKTVALGSKKTKYKFTKGIMECTLDESLKLEPILSRYYGAKLITDKTQFEKLMKALAKAEAEAEAKAKAEAEK